MKQLSFFEELENSPKSLLDLLREHIDISKLIPYSFYRAFYQNEGRDRKYSLESFIYALLLQKMLTLPTTELLINLLNMFGEFRDFCGFYKGVPDKTQFSKFKTNFVDNFEDTFHHLVDMTESICQKLGKEDARILIIDTTGIEPYVAENNPKYVQCAIKKVNSLIKSNDNIKIENINQSIMSNMQKHTYANSDVKLQYTNGHFTYAIKGTLMCNAHGILRHMQIDDFDQDIKELEHSKHVNDSTLFVPSLNNFTMLHPDIKAKYICGDSGFDSAFNHNSAFKDFNLIPIIDLNTRNTKSEIPDVNYTDDGSPACPKDRNFPFKHIGICEESGRATRFKHICPKTKSNITYYETPCSSSKCGYIHYEYEADNLRANPSIGRDTDKYIQIASKRVIIERVISILKLPLSMSVTYTRNSKTIKADFFMAGIAHLVNVLLADSMNMLSKVRSTKSIA